MSGDTSSCIGQEVPPREYREQLGTDPIGVIIQDDDLAGADVRAGTVAWISTTEPPTFKDGTFVLANVREQPGDDIKTVCRLLLEGDGERQLFTVPEKGREERYAPAEVILLAPVVCFRERVPESTYVRLVWPTETTDPDSPLT